MANTKSYSVTLTFTIGCRTTGYTMAAASPEAARVLAEACIGEDGLLDLEKFEKMGGTVGGWEFEDGSDSEYELADDRS